MRGRTGRTCALALVAGIAWTGAAQAKTFEVTKRGDPAPGTCTGSDCSLREAVQAANARPGADIVVLANARKPYKLTIPGDTADDASDGDLDITNDPLSIRHPGRGRAEIRGVALSDRLFDVFGGAPLRLAKLKLTGGAVPPSNGDGGAIRADDRVVIQRSVVRGNTTEERGGAVHTEDPLTIARSVITDNRSTGQGGAFNVGGEAPLRIVRSVVRSNETESTGGAIRNSNGPVTILRSRFSGNEAFSLGGALRNAGDGDILIDRSSFTGNSAGDVGGALELNESETVIRRTTISGNRADADGGGLESSAGGDLTITTSTISGNRAGEDGGGIYLDGPTAQITNSTIAGNRALDFGGGVFVGGVGGLKLNAVTIARNHGSTDDEGAHAPGGGIFRHTTGTVSVRNTIIALNRLGVEPIRNDCGGEVGEPFDSLGNNLLSTLAPSGICNGFDGPGDRVRSNPRIGNLRKNGGPTKTIALKKGSAAIGHAHKPSAPNRDQRGRKRDNNPDTGAFERGA